MKLPLKYWLINKSRNAHCLLLWLISLVYTQRPTITVFAWLPADANHAEGLQEIARWRGQPLEVGDLFEPLDARYRTYRVLSRKAYYHPKDSSRYRPVVKTWELRAGIHR